MKHRDKYIKEWFIKGEHDLKSAELIFKKKKYYDTAVILLEQAVEKYLKGYLIHKGWKLKKVHDLSELIKESTKYNKDFEKYIDLSLELTEYYFEEKYPFEINNVGIDKDELKNKFKEAKKLIKLIKNQLKEI